MESITVVFNKKLQPSDINGGGVFSEMDWSRLEPHLRQVFACQENEVIDGIVLSENGIKVKFSTNTHKNGK